MHKHVIIDSSDGYEVYVNLIKSLAGQYLSRQPYVMNLIKQVAEPMKLTGPRVTIEHNMGRVIGNTEIIDTTEEDTIYYALPHKKDVFSRYAKNRYPAPSKVLTIILEKDADGNYEVYDTWIGPYSPPFPGDEKETAKSKLFWETHALAQDVHAVQSKSITKTCPY